MVYRSSLKSNTKEHLKRYASLHTNEPIFMIASFLCISPFQHLFCCLANTWNLPVIPQNHTGKNFCFVHQDPSFYSHHGYPYSPPNSFHRVNDFSNHPKLYTPSSAGIMSILNAYQLTPSQSSNSYSLGFMTSSVLIHPLISHFIFQMLSSPASVAKTLTP